MICEESLYFVMLSCIFFSFFRLKNSQKLQIARSREKGGCSITLMRFRPKNSTVNFVIWEEALSWWSISLFYIHFWKNFWKTFSDVLLAVTVFSPSILMALTRPVFLKKMACITFFIAHSFFTIFDLGTSLKTYTLLSWCIGTSKNGMYISSPVWF